MRPRRRPHPIAVAALTGLLAAGPAFASTFNPARIIEDSEMRDTAAMSYADIQGFLSRKGGLGDRYDVDPSDGLLKGSAQLIADAAARHDINPKYILALIQKESSAVESPVPTSKQLDWATGYALCDACSRSSAMALKYRGFGKQVDAAAAWMDWYLTNAKNGTRNLPQAGDTITVNDTAITPENLATAALYSYTPHFHGNQLLWMIWNRWFGDGAAGLRFPDGTLVRDDGTGQTALVQAGKLRPILNASILDSRFAGQAPVDIDHAQYDSLAKTVPGTPVRFADLSLVRVENGDIYLLVGTTKRRVASPDAFIEIGFNPEEVEDAKLADIADYHDGQPIDADASFPIGQLLQDTKTGGVYYAESGVKRPIVDRAILKADFAGRPLVPTAPSDLARLKTGDPMAFLDGTLVKAPDDPTVYVISGGVRRPIPDEETFLLFGYQWHNVLTASRRAITIHPLGDPLDIEIVSASPDAAAPQQPAQP